MILDCWAGRARRVLAVMGLAAITYGCTQDPKGPCPFVRIPSTLATVTKFNGAATPQNQVYQARIADVALQCTYAEQKRAGSNIDIVVDELEVLLKVRVAATAGPRAGGSTADGRFFVAVTDLRDTILDRLEFPVKLNLGQGGRAATTEDEAYILFRLRGKSGAAYRIFTGFQLTPEETEYNRKLLAN
jgi:hypothetical protein